MSCFEQCSRCSIPLSHDVYQCSPTRTMQNLDLAHIEICLPHLSHPCTEIPTHIIIGSRHICPEGWAALSHRTQGAFGGQLPCSRALQSCPVGSGDRASDLPVTRLVPQPPAHDCLTQYSAYIMQIYHTAIPVVSLSRDCQLSQ